jgi:hypothetical protein
MNFGPTAVKKCRKSRESNHKKLTESSACFQGTAYNESHDYEVITMAASEERPLLALGIKVTLQSLSASVLAGKIYVDTLSHYPRDHTDRPGNGTNIGESASCQLSVLPARISG